MTRTTLGALIVSTFTLFALQATAAVTPEEAKQLGTTLTEFGA